MKVAIPLFNDRISPRFDVCPEIWIIELENGEVIHQGKWSMARFNLPQRLDQLIAKGVDKIICGGIDSFSVDQLGNRGIDVIHNVTGEAEKVLNLFIGGVLRSGFYCKGERGFQGREKSSGEGKT